MSESKTLANPGRATVVYLSGTLFSSEGKLLLLERQSATVCEGESLIEFPGGQCDFGEPPEVALMRCFMETTDIEVVPDRTLGAWSELRRSSIPSMTAASGVEHAATLEHEEYVVHIDYVVKASSAITGVDLDTQRHRSFGWYPQKEALEALQTPALKALGERAFAMLSRTRRNG
jgi:ADP-ribose pyrophosphatase YjhB (NUDIX family)